MNKKIWLLTFILIIVFGFIYLLFSSDERLHFDDFQSITFRGFEGAKAQKVKDRVWRKAILINVFSTSERLFTPTLIKADRFGNAYVLDWADFKIKKFSPKGEFVGEYGRGKGNGPGEFLNPTDFVIDNEFNLWVNDPYAGIITCIGRDNNIRLTFRPKNIALKLCLLQDKIALNRATPFDYLFDIYDKSGNYNFSIVREILPEQSKFALLMGGYIDCDFGEIYYAFDRLNYLIAVDINNKVVKYIRKTIDDITPPEVKIKETKSGPVMILGKDKEFSALSMNLAGGIIYITSGKNWGVKDSITIVDAYSKDDGSYLYSFKIPEKFKYGYFDGRFYYGVKDTSISKWEVIFK